VIFRAAWATEAEKRRESANVERIVEEEEEEGKERGCYVNDGGGWKCL